MIWIEWSIVGWLLGMTIHCLVSQTMLSKLRRGKVDKISLTSDNILFSYDDSATLHWIVSRMEMQITDLIKNDAERSKGMMEILDTMRELSISGSKCPCPVCQVSSDHWEKQYKKNAMMTGKAEVKTKVKVIPPGCEPNIVHPRGLADADYINFMDVDESRDGNAARPEEN